MAIYNISTNYNDSSEEIIKATVGFYSAYDEAVFEEALSLPPVDIRLQSDGNRLFLGGENKYNFRYNPRTTKVPLLPEIKHNIIEISGKDGGYDFGTTYGSRVISIDLWSSKNLTNSQIVEQKNYLRDFFVDGDVKRFTSEKNDSSIYYNVKLYKTIEFVEYAGWFQTIITLIAVDAYGYEFNSKTSSIPWSAEFTQAELNIINKQNRDNGFIISITGALYDPKITITDPDASATGVLPTVIQFAEGHKQIAEDEVILIDMSKMIAVKTKGISRTNALPLFDTNNDIYTKVKAHSTRNVKIVFSTEGINSGSIGVFYTGYGI